MRSLRVLLPACTALFACVQASGQAVISARSGVVHYSEGSVFLDNQPLEQKTATFPVIKEGSTLRTEKGRAEILLTPGVFLRLDENSTIRMRTTALADTRVEFLQGCILLDTIDALADNHVTLIYKDSQIRFPKSGVYRIDFDTATLQAYSGEAEVLHDGKTSPVDDSHLFFLTLDLTTKKLDASEDEFYDWARDRSNTISAENQLASQGDSGDVDADADPDPLGGALPNLGGAGIPDPGMGGITPYPTPSYNYPMSSVLLNPFSSYAVGFPYAPYPFYPALILVAPYRSVHSRWPHSTTGITTVGTWQHWNGVSHLPARPLTLPSVHPLPPTMARPTYARPAYTRPAIAPHPMPTPAAIHAIGHR